MNFIKNNFNNIKTSQNTGFGTNASSYGGRFINKDGSANLSKKGIRFFESISWYHTFIDMPRWKFLSIITLFYILINLIFALVYTIIGIEHFNGTNANGDFWKQFEQLYFFSTQTFTTVGYGHVSPSGFWASSIASVEAMIGLLSFAIATGLFFGRFSKPTAYLRFSKNALIAPYQGISALMLRVTPFKNTNFTDAEAKLTLGMIVEQDGIKTNKFYILDLELEKINSLYLSWTLVHPITPESPLYGLSADDFKNMHGEVLVFIKTFDDLYSNTVLARSSYVFNEIIFGAKFDSMYSKSEDNLKTILHLDKLDSYAFVDIEQIF